MGVIPSLAACHACVLMLYCIVTIVRYVCSFEWQINFSLSPSDDLEECVIAGTAGLDSDGSVYVAHIFTSSLNKSKTDVTVSRSSW